MSELKTNKISPAVGTDVTLGDSGDTINIPSGVTLTGDIPAVNLTGALPAISGANLTNLPGGGKVLQVVQSPDMTSVFASTSTTYADVGISLNITPSSTSSKIYLTLSGNFWANQPDASGWGNGPRFKMLRDSTQINEWNSYFDFPVSADRHAFAVTRIFSAVLLDTPSTTSQINYKLQAKKNSSSVATIQIPYPVSSTPTQFYNHCRLVAMEIGA